MPNPSDTHDPKALIQVLKQGDPALVLQAITRLGTLQSAATEALPHLLSTYVSTPDEQIRSAAKQALTSIDPQWPSHPLITRKAPDLVYHLADLARIPQTEECLLAIGKASLEALLDGLINIDADIRTASLRILQQIDPQWSEAAKHSSKVEDLFEKLESRIQEVAQAAEHALKSMGTPIIEHLFPHALSVDDKKRQQAQKLLLDISPTWHDDIPPHAIVPTLVKELDSKFPIVFNEASKLIRKIDEPALPFLADVLEPHVQSSVTLKIKALKLIGYIGNADDRTLELIIRILENHKNENPDLILACLVTLRNLEHAEAALLNTILPLLDHSNGQIKLETIKYIADCGPKAENASLILGVMLSDKDNQIIDASQKALIAIGPACGPYLTQVLLAGSDSELADLLTQFVGNFVTSETNRTGPVTPGLYSNLSWINLYFKDSALRLIERRTRILEVLDEVKYAHIDLIKPLQEMLNSKEPAVQQLARAIYGRIRF